MKIQIVFTLFVSTSIALPSFAGAGSQCASAVSGDEARSVNLPGVPSSLRARIQVGSTVYLTGDIPTIHRHSPSVATMDAIAFEKQFPGVKPEVILPAITAQNRQAAFAPVVAYLLGPKKAGGDLSTEETLRNAGALRSTSIDLGEIARHLKAGKLVLVDVIGHGFYDYRLDASTGQEVQANVFMPTKYGQSESQPMLLTSLMSDADASGKSTSVEAIAVNPTTGQAEIIEVRARELVEAYLLNLEARDVR